MARDGAVPGPPVRPRTSRLRGCPQCLGRISLYFLEGHAAGQAPYNNGNRCTRAANDWLAVADGWVNGNSLIHRSLRLRYTPAKATCYFPLTFSESDRPLKELRVEVQFIILMAYSALDLRSLAVDVDTCSASCYVR